MDGSKPVSLRRSPSHIHILPTCLPSLITQPNSTKVNKTVPHTHPLFQNTSTKEKSSLYSSELTFMNSNMKSNYISLHLFFTIFLLILLPSSSSSSSSSSPSSSSSSATLPKLSKIYAFGDSYTDTGNIKSGLPNGITFFHHPSNRFSDGRLVVDFLSQSLSLPLLPPYLDRSSFASDHGVNFAASGSTAIDHDFYVKNNITLSFVPYSLHSQLGWFEEFLQRRGCTAPWTSSQCLSVIGGDDATLFWVGQIGANDYAYTFGHSVPADTVKALAVKSTTDFLQAILKMGAKRIVVQGLSPIGCLPLSLVLAPDVKDRDKTGCVESANNRSYNHNSILQANLMQLRKQYPQAVISYADFWNAYKTVMTNPQKYGFTEPFQACCGSGSGPYNFDITMFCSSTSRACSNPRQFINWDGVHLTEAMYGVVADMFLHQGFCHPSFETLLSSKMVASMMKQ